VGRTGGATVVWGGTLITPRIWIVHGSAMVRNCEPPGAEADPPLPCSNTVGTLSQGHHGVGHSPLDTGGTYILLGIAQWVRCINCWVRWITTVFCAIGEIMDAASALSDNMRKDADWMVPSDDRILELLREKGNLTPQAVEDFGGPTAGHAQDRLPALTRYGLVNRISRGLYTISDAGRAYLDEDLDASTLEPSEEWRRSISAGVPARGTISTCQQRLHVGADSW